MGDTSPYNLTHGDCLDVLPSLEASSVDLILTDPPYFKVNGEAWDRQWGKPAAFLQWLDAVLTQFQRVLKPNGSLYLFASPQMSARVECLVSERFNVLNRIRWVKKAGRHNKTEKEALRSYLSPWEEILFAEQAADQYAEAERALHKNVFAPVGRYIQTERERAGLTRTAVEVAMGYTSKSDPTKGTALCYRWEEGACLPTRDAYERLRGVLNSHGADAYLQREFGEITETAKELRREFEDLRREFEDLRRPFNARQGAEWSDVWDFGAVQGYDGKHPCEKPQALLRHAITTSSRPGAVVLDAFAGSGSTALACMETGRQFIGIEKDAGYFKAASKRIREAQWQPRLLEFA